VDKLTDILCHREQRYVGSQLTLSYDRKRIILERSATSEDLCGKYVDVYDFPDGRLEVRSKGLLRDAHAAQWIRLIYACGGNHRSIKRRILSQRTWP
jgi:hypothetical protein